MIFSHQNITQFISVLCQNYAFGLLLVLQIKTRMQKNEDDIVISRIALNGLREQEHFTFINQLQKTLKNQFYLLRTESDQKSMFEKKMNTTLFSYYRSTVNLGESVYQTLQQEKSKLDRSVSSTNMFLMTKGDKADKGLKYEQQKKLLQDEGFGDVYTFVKEVVLSLSKDPYLMMILIQKHQNTYNIESLTSLAKVIVNCMYENIVDDDVYSKDILKIITYCVKKAIEDKKHYFDINLQQRGFLHLLLAEVSQRTDCKQYAKQIAKNTILQIAKVDHLIDFKLPQEEQYELRSTTTTRLDRKQSSKYQERESSPKHQPTHRQEEITNSKIKQYSQCLRIQDEKIRKRSIIKRKYRNCISQDLLNLLNVNEQILFPCFYSRQNKEMKLEQEINRQLGKMLNKSQSKMEAAINSDIVIIKNVVLIFFNDIFKMLYSMPPIMRISCKILFKYLRQKFNVKNCLYVVADFIINFWLLSSLNIDITIVQATKLSPYIQRNAEQISTIIKSIVKDNYKDVNPMFIREFNLLVTNLKVSVTNYINQVINIDDARIDALCEEVQECLQKKASQKKIELKSIRSYCVCISMADLKRLIDMIKKAEKEISAVNQRIIKRVQRIDMMTEGKQIFGDKTYKSTGKLYRASKAYALFTDLMLPSHLSMDYYKTYNNAFKGNKQKNILRQVLLSLNDLQTFQQYYTSNTIQDLFQSLQYGGQDENLYTFDHVSLKLKLNYLQILSRKYKLIDLATQLNDQTQKRFGLFKSTWQTSKECYLKAITSINFQNDRLCMKENYIKDEIKRRKLDDFISKHEIKLCLTSPKTREKQIVLKTNLMKDVTEQYKQRLWLENQSKCIHTALNLDFIKSLTGQPQKHKIKYESHINSIMKFSQILCGLPEVKERFSMVQDNIGIKQVFFDFIKFIREFIQAKQGQYVILLENLQWLEENIQLKISKRLYEKLYPRYPLYDDVALHIRLRTLSWLSYDHLNIDASLRNDNLWEVAAGHLRQIDKLRTAAQKLHCIEETTRIIFNSYALMSKSQKPAAADDIYPLIILVLIRAAPKRLVSSINFIQSFASPSKLVSQGGYCFTQLKGAVQFCDILSSENIKLSENKAENYIAYNKKIYEKEIQYGIYFMLGRRRESQQANRQKLQYLKEYFKKNQ